MSVSSPTKKKRVAWFESEAGSDFLTTTKFAEFCGVSRFTIINWAKQGKIKGVMKTAGGHFRIPAAEASSVFLKLNAENKAKMSDTQGRYRRQKSKTDGDQDCSRRLSDHQRGQDAAAEKKKLLYNFGYRIGRSVKILKERK